MNVVDFEELSKILLLKSNDGDCVNDSGTRLIGHAPDIAPRAFRHIVYAGLNPSLLNEMEGRIGAAVPKQLSDFLVQANGLIAFDGALRVFGYVPLNSPGPRSIRNYPPSITASNSYEELAKQVPGSLIVGWYKEDGSYVYLDTHGRARRFDYQGSGTNTFEWEGFDHWLQSEIVRLNETAL